MRKLLLPMALLGAMAVGLPAMAAGSNSAGKSGTTSTTVPETAAAAKGGVTGSCPKGQVQSVNGHCAPGQPAATGTMSGGNKAASEMPASPHQQEVLKPKPKKGG